MLESIRNAYKTAWDWSLNAGSIVLARLTAIAGVVTSGIAMIDWSPLYNLFGASPVFNKEQTLVMGLFLLVQGIVQEIVRRANTVVTEANKLVSKDLTVTEVKAAKKKAK